MKFEPISDLYIDFEPINTEKVENVQEKYVRRGPSSRYKVAVTPIKILTRCKGGTPCYKTYYVSSAKYQRYKQIAKQQYGRVANPKYITYWNEAGARLKHYRIRGWQRKFLGDSFTNEFAHVSGAVFRHRNQLEKFGYPGADKIVSSSYDRKTGTHTVELADGTKISSRMLLSRNGRLTLKTETTTRDATGNQLTTRSRISGKITNEKFQDGTKRRVFTIDKLEGYDAEMLSGFMDYMQSRFARIDAKISGLNDEQIGALLLNGFGANVKVNNNLKQKILQKLQQNRIIRNPRVKKWIQEAKTVADVMNALVKAGITSERNPVLEDVINHVRSNTDTISFESVDPTGKVKNTKSQNTLHSYQLQISADNDYHKGFRRYKNLVRSSS